MNHGSLFSGIGGFDLASEWMGWNNAFHCEINPFCQKVLKYHFPNAISYADIKTTDFTEWNGKIDIVSGGFPCQPYSVAGNRKGKDDDRHLWPEMLRSIKQIQPSWIVGENVPGIINWSKGMVFNEVQTDLEAAGFEIFPPLILPACGVNASHKRDRVWFVAYSYNNKHIRNAGRYEGTGNTEGVQERNKMELFNKSNSLWDAPNSNGIGQQGGEQRMQEAQPQRHDTESCTTKQLQYSKFGDSLSAPRIFRGNDGLSNGVDRVKALGNSVVPQVVYQIFKAIEQYENKTT